jgi:signal peptidase I
MRGGTMNGRRLAAAQTRTPAAPRAPWRSVVLLGRRPRATALRLLVLAAVTAVVFTWVLFPARVTGGSMEPTLPDGRFELVNRWAYRSARPRRGDIVSIGDADRRGAMYMKRIVGLPGETCAIWDGVLHVDGRRVEEPYVVHRAPWHVPAVTLGPDEYFVVGDNRGMPAENHWFGRVKRRYIAGKVLR